MALVQPCVVASNLVSKNVCFSSQNHLGARYSTPLDRKLKSRNEPGALMSHFRNFRE